MRYLLDSDWVIDCLWRKQSALEHLEAVLSHGVAISTVSLAELFDGALGSANRSRDVERLLTFLFPVTRIPVDEGIAYRFAEIRLGLRQRGMLISDLDIFIAATALDHDLILLTRNVRHFTRIDGVHIYPSTI